MGSVGTRTGGRAVQVHTDGRPVAEWRVLGEELRHANADGRSSIRVRPEQGLAVRDLVDLIRRSLNVNASGSNVSMQAQILVQVLYPK